MTSAAFIVILFIVGFVAPPAAKPLQRWIHRKFKRMEKKTDKAPGIATPILKLPLRATRKSAVKSVVFGKKLRDKAPF